MEINPLQFLGAFAAACVVLVIARIKGNRQLPAWFSLSALPERFSLGALIVAMSILGGALTLLGHALKK